MNLVPESWIDTTDLGGVMAALLGLVVVVILHRLIRRAITHHVDDRRNRQRLRRATSWISSGLAVGVLLSIPANGLGQWTVFVGLLGAGLAFALQEVIASLAGWLVLSTGGFYRVGHRVQLGGIRGDVIDIGPLRTTLMELGQWVQGDLYNGRIVRVANSFVFKEPVFNYTSDFPFLWDEIHVPVTFESDRHLARTLLTQAATAITGAYAERVQEGWQTMVRKYPIEDPPLQPAVSLEVTDNWLAYTVRYVVDTTRRRAVRDALFERILDDIDASQGRVALASETLRVLSEPSGE